MFKIEKNQVSPTVSTVRKYPFRSMEVGDSFFVPGGKPVNVGSAAAAHANTASGRAGKKQFSVRRVEGGVRCWRVA